MMHRRQEYNEAIDRHLARGERRLFHSRQHPIVLWRSTLIAGGISALCLRVLAAGLSDPAGRSGQRFFLAVLTATVIWWLLKLATWGNQWFAVTNKRLIFLEGIIDRDVKMMPLGKLTDMNFRRTWLGDLLGYAHFDVESAGQDQALSRLKFIPNAGKALEEITQVLFAFWPTIVKAHDDGFPVQATLIGGEDDEDGDWVEEGPDDPGPGGGGMPPDGPTRRFPGLPGRRASQGGPTHREAFADTGHRNPVQDRRRGGFDHDYDARSARGAASRAADEYVYRSSEAERRRRQLADTGEIDVSWVRLDPATGAPARRPEQRVGEPRPQDRSDPAGPGRSARGIPERSVTDLYLPRDWDDPLGER